MLRAPLTTLLVMSIVAVFALELIFAFLGQGGLLRDLGANFGPLVAEGQLWRLVSSMFLHGGLFHLAVNGWALYQLGTLVELWMGKGRLLVVYVVTGVAGSIASVAWNLFGAEIPRPSVGASGAIFGLLGALIAFLVRRRDRLRPEAKSILRSLSFWAAINVFLGLTVPVIDNAAHLGGLFAGFALGWFLQARRRLRQPPPPPPDPQEVWTHPSSSSSTWS
ncbi:MAG: rhomboid family intramembrane serine protease [Acidobacteriota bacterium]